MKKTALLTVMLAMIGLASVAMVQNVGAQTTEEFQSVPRRPI